MNSETTLLKFLKKRHNVYLLSFVSLIMFPLTSKRQNYTISRDEEEGVNEVT